MKYSLFLKWKLKFHFKYIKVEFSFLLNFSCVFSYKWNLLLHFSFWIDFFTHIMFLISPSLHISATFTSCFFHFPMNFVMRSTLVLHKTPYILLLSVGPAFYIPFFQIPLYDGHFWYWLVVGWKQFHSHCGLSTPRICCAQHTKKCGTYCMLHIII